MKTIISIILMSVIFTSFSFPQNAKSSQSKSYPLPSLMKVLDRIAFTRFYFELQTLAEAPSHAKSPEYAIADLDTFLTKKPTQNKLTEFKLIQTKTVF